MLLDALVVDGEASSDPAKIVSGLSRHWEPVFCATPVAETMHSALEALRPYLPDLSGVRKLSPPSSSDFTRSAEFAKSTAPGKDCVSYTAWATQQGGRTLQRLFHVNALGISPALAYNDSLSLFIPKGSKDLDVTRVERRPDETRPLGLKNSDNKTIASAVNFRFSYVM
jgi:hypothetical protein